MTLTTIAFLLFLSLQLHSGYALTASETLKLHGGYSLASSHLPPSGTFLAPPDSSFSPFLRPSPSLLLSHTLQLRLTSQTLTQTPHLQTMQSKCFPLSSIKIVHPDIYSDENLIVHGIDTVLDPASMHDCTAERVSARSTFLDRAAWALRRKGFGVVATALSVKKSDLAKFAAVTVFAVSDESLFSEREGFRYDFLRHVAPGRHRFDEVAGLEKIETLVPGKTVRVGAVGLSEIYQNRWIVVIEIAHSLDDGDSPSLATVGVYGEEDEGPAEDWRRSAPPPESEEKLCMASDHLFCQVGERGSNLGVRSEPFVSEKMVESAPSHQMNKAIELGPLDETVTRRLLEESIADNAQCKLSSSQADNQVIELGSSGEMLSGKATDDTARRRLASVQNRERDHIVQLADDLFYYS